MIGNLKKGDGSIYDVTKVLLSIMIICIHSCNIPDYVNPLLRIAVPLFFIMSSFFFWQKVIAASEPQKKSAIIRFVKRNFLLFLFWTIALSPKLDFSHYFVNGYIGVIQFVRDLLFCDTFKGSWFIMSSIQALYIIFLLSRYISNKSIFIISFSFYIFCCCSSNYFEEFNSYKTFQCVNDLIHHLVGEASLSFFVAMIWVVIGKIFAETQDLIINIVNNNIKIIYCLFLITCFFLIVEHSLISYKYGERLTSDCYMFLVPVCSSIFLLIYKYNTFSLKCHLFLRHVSTVVYCMHGFVLLELSRNSFFADNVLILVLFTFIICFVATLLLHYMSKIKLFHFLSISF